MNLELKTFENLLIPGVNSLVLEVQGKERKALYDHMASYDMPTSTSYTRMFRQGFGSGFEAWELSGVREVIRDFCKENGMEAPTEEDMPMFYLERLEGQREKFCAFLLERGMSRSTCIYRFKNWNFKKWELKGIRAIIEELCNQPAA